MSSVCLAIPVQADTILGQTSAGGGAVAAPDNPPETVTAANEKLRRLDIMLMVTGLRCRTTADDFQADFQAFEARHLPELNAAARALVEQYGGRMSPAEANHTLDRISVQIANHYGNGHPWLGCHELKGLAQALAQTDGRDALLAAANETLDGDGEVPTIAGATVIAYGRGAGNPQLAGR